MYIVDNVQVKTESVSRKNIFSLTNVFCENTKRFKKFKLVRFKHVYLLVFKRLYILFNKVPYISILY